MAKFDSENEKMLDVSSSFARRKMQGKIVYCFESCKAFERKILHMSPKNCITCLQGSKDSARDTCTTVEFYLKNKNILNFHKNMKNI
jgi:hypothetical protein